MVTLNVKRERKPRHFKQEKLQKYFGVSSMAELETKYGYQEDSPSEPKVYDENGEPLYMELDEDNV